jgi:hypothetical protein
MPGGEPTRGGGDRGVAVGRRILGGRPERWRRIVATTGLALLLVGAALIAVTAAAVRAGAASRQSLSVSPDSHLTATKEVKVSGTGFAHRSPGAVLECNPSPGEPAATITIDGVTHAIPVGCSAPVFARTSRYGLLATKTIPVQEGTLGSWETGLDSSGRPAAVDASSYPCPPTAAQESASVLCVFQFVDNHGDVAVHSVRFRSSGPGSTTTTTATTTTVTTTIPTSTTTVACTPQSRSVTASGSNGSGTLTVNPATCLVNGTVVTLTATGLKPYNKSTNYLGTLLQCNDDPNQPTDSLLGHAIPVSCTGALAHDFTPNSAGTFSGSLSVIQGVTGPPVSGNPTDSAGNPSEVDAAKYPCPPTSAQLAIGDSCVIALGDVGGDQITVPISYNPG